VLKEGQTIERYLKNCRMSTCLSIRLRMSIRQRRIVLNQLERDADVPYAEVVT